MKREHGHNTVNEKALGVFVGVVNFGIPSAVALPGTGEYLQLYPPGGTKALTRPGSSEGGTSQKG